MGRLHLSTPKFPWGILHGQNEAFSLIRYGTRGITYVDIEECGCERTLIRQGAMRFFGGNWKILISVSFSDQFDECL